MLVHPSIINWSPRWSRNGWYVHYTSVSVLHSRYATRDICMKHCVCLPLNFYNFRKIHQTFILQLNTVLVHFSPYACVSFSFLLFYWANNVFAYTRLCIIGPCIQRYVLAAECAADPFSSSVKLRKSSSVYIRGVCVCFRGMLTIEFSTSVPF